LDGRVAIITGASGNLGVAVARKFFREGALLALVHYAHEPAPEFALPQHNVLSLALDLANPDSGGIMASQVMARFGRIDILANIAGGFSMGKPVHETSPQTWESMFSLNAGTAINACSAVIPVMRDRRYGKIVNVGAQVALAGRALMAPYIVSKSAVRLITESLSEENRTFGINVNCVLPGIIDTPQNRREMPDADDTSWATPEAIADVLAFLASDASAALHGTAIPVSGPC
jgi:NAD(P)-dependent dehydrogenase (short-subunit alcohol dehydrogenase family)